MILKNDPSHIFFILFNIMNIIIKRKIDRIDHEYLVLVGYSVCWKKLWRWSMPMSIINNLLQRHCSSSCIIQLLLPRHGFCLDQMVHPVQRWQKSLTLFRHRFFFYLDGRRFVSLEQWVKSSPASLGAHHCRTQRTKDRRD